TTLCPRRYTRARILRSHRHSKTLRGVLGRESFPLLIRRSRCRVFEMESVSKPVSLASPKLQRSSDAEYYCRRVDAVELERLILKANAGVLSEAEGAADSVKGIGAVCFLT